MVSWDGGGGEIVSTPLAGCPTSLEMLTRIRNLDSIDYEESGEKVKLEMKMSAFLI